MNIIQNKNEAVWSQCWKRLRTGQPLSSFQQRRGFFSSALHQGRMWGSPRLPSNDLGLFPRDQCDQSVKSLYTADFISPLRPLVTTGTTRLHTTQFYILPEECILMCFASIISRHSINWLLSIQETKCVYCAVRNESHVHSRLQMLVGEASTASYHAWGEANEQLH